MLNTKLRRCLSIICCALPQTVMALAFGPVDPVHMGMGGAAVAVPGYFTPAANPAHLAMVNLRRDVFVDLPGVGQADTAPGRFDGPLERFQSSATTFLSDPSAGNRTAAESAAADLDGRTDYRNRWLTGFAGLPHLPVAMAGYVSGQDMETLSAELGQQDLGTSPPTFAVDVIQRGLLVVEGGAVLAKVIGSTAGGANRLAVGIAPKLVSLRSSYFRIPATEDPGNAAEIHRSGSHFNLDIGLVKEFGFVWKAGVVVRNVVPESVKWADPARGSLELQPQARAGLAYRRPDLLVTADVDLTRNGAVGFEGASRMLAIGGEWSATTALRLRGGIYGNLLDGRTGASLGLGTSLNILTFDVAAFGDTEQRRGVVARVGVRF